MRFRPLLVGDPQQADIKRLMDFADAHRASIHDLYNILGGRAKPPGDDDNFVCVVPVGYRCVYTVEQQKAGWCRHLSVSVLGDGTAPAPEAVLMLMKEFGFKGGFADLHHMGEEPFDIGKTAINVIQLL